MDEPKCYMEGCEEPATFYLGEEGYCYVDGMNESERREAMPDTPKHATQQRTQEAIDKRECPHDQGTCHHKCESACFREQQGYSLTDKPEPKIRGLLDLDRQTLAFAGEEHPLRRVHACVKACANIPRPEHIKELVEAVSLANGSRFIRANGQVVIVGERWQAIEAALAKLKGDQ